jgi:hypothetical protein
MTMKPFIASLDRFGKFGYHFERAALVVAVSRSDVLGRVLMRYPDSSADEWTIEEVCLSDESVTEIYEREN